MKLSKILEHMAEYILFPLIILIYVRNKGNTYYGNKIALLKPISDEVYYEYMEDTFVGNKVYVTKVMYLSSVETWKYFESVNCKSQRT